MFYSYHNLQGSQTPFLRNIANNMFYSYHNLQGSQTEVNNSYISITFYSYHNLQGSQTQMVISEPIHLVNGINYNIFTLLLNTGLCQ